MVRDQLVIRRAGMVQIGGPTLRRGSGFWRVLVGGLSLVVEVRDEWVEGAVVPLKGPPEVRGDGAAYFVDEFGRFGPVREAPGLPGGRCE